MAVPSPLPSTKSELRNEALERRRAYARSLSPELRAEMEAEPVQFLWRRFEERLEPSRQALAGFIGAQAKDIVFVANATGAKQGAEVLRKPVLQHAA